MPHGLGMLRQGNIRHIRAAFASWSDKTAQRNLTVAVASADA
jgi:hypothetical protein